MSGLARQLGNPDGVPGRIIGHGLNRANRRYVSAAVSETAVGPGQLAADIGFGGGLGLRLLLDRVGQRGHVDGVDRSETMLKAARRNHRVACAEGRLSLRAGTIVDLPIADSCLDGLITVNTIYFVEDLERAFGEMARVLRPAGRAVVGIGDPTAMGSTAITAHGFRLRPVDEVTRVLKQAGLSDVRHQRVGDEEDAFHLLIGSRSDSSESFRV